LLFFPLICGHLFQAKWNPYGAQLMLLGSEDRNPLQGVAKYET